MLELTLWAQHVVAAMMVGMLSEAFAWRIGLWRYPSKLTLMSNVLLTFGVVMGSIAATGWSAPAKFLLAGLIGWCLEWTNVKYWQAWHFPPARWHWLGGDHAISALLSWAWACVPLITATVLSWGRAQMN